MRKNIGLIASLAAAMAVPASSASPRAMTLAIFLEKVEPILANPLKAKSSADYQLLDAELNRAQDHVLTANSTRSTERGGQLSCPPKTPRIDMRELIADFRRYKREDRASMTVAEGLSAFMVNKFPCR